MSAGYPEHRNVANVKARCKRYTNLTGGTYRNVGFGGTIVHSAGSREMRAIQQVHLRDTGPKVSNLHKGLLFLVLHQRGIDDNDREILSQRLAPEVRTQTFGNATAELIGIWQYQFKNWPNYLPALPQSLKAQVQNLPIACRHLGYDVVYFSARCLS
jgi:hypothetical protein